MTDAVSRVLGLRPGEVAPASALFALSFVLGLACITLEVAVSTGLLVGLDATELPWKHVVSGVALPLAGAALAWARPRVSFAWFVTAPLVSIAVPLLALVILLGDAAPGPAWLLLWGGTRILSAAAIVAFWSIAARTFDVTQAPRVYGVISAGEVLAGVLAGLVAGPLQGALSPVTLLGLAVTGVLAGVLLALPLARRAPEEEAPRVTADTGVLHRTHARRVLLYYALGNITFDVIEFVVLVALQRTFPGQPEALAGALGGLLSLRLALSAGIRLFLAGRLAERLGLLPGLASTPAAVGLVGAIGMAIPFVGPVVLAVAMQTAEATVRGGLGKPAFMATQRVLPPTLRDRTLLAVETAVDPLTTGLCGLALLLVPSAWLAGSAVLLLPLPSALGQLVAARALRTSYTRLSETP